MDDTAQYTIGGGGGGIAEYDNVEDTMRAHTQAKIAQNYMDL